MQPLRHQQSAISLSIVNQKFTIQMLALLSETEQWPVQFRTSFSGCTITEVFAEITSKTILPPATKLSPEQLRHVAESSGPVLTAR